MSNQKLRISAHGPLYRCFRIFFFSSLYSVFRVYIHVATPAERCGLAVVIRIVCRSYEKYFTMALLRLIKSTGFVT